LVESLKPIGARLHATPGQLALAWLLARKPWIVPIPGTRHRSRLEENLAATKLALESTDIAAIEDAVRAHPVEGQRYTPEGMAMVNL
jgi:aryl-alcohol dehydrogenase-like predicted oxidoreductase